jgi:hypothetical protein
MFLGAGGLLNKFEPKSNQSPSLIIRGASQIKQEAPGSHLGAGAAGGLLNDGTVPIDDYSYMANNRKTSVSSPILDMVKDT